MSFCDNTQRIARPASNPAAAAAPIAVMVREQDSLSTLEMRSGLK